MLRAVGNNTSVSIVPFDAKRMILEPPHLKTAYSSDARIPEEKAEPCTPYTTFVIETEPITKRIF
jgi:hypothetical protein